MFTLHQAKTNSGIWRHGQFESFMHSIMYTPFLSSVFIVLSTVHVVCMGDVCAIN